MAEIAPEVLSQIGLESGEEILERWPSDADWNEGSDLVVLTKHRILLVRSSNEEQKVWKEATFWTQAHWQVVSTQTKIQVAEQFALPPDEEVINRYHGSTTTRDVDAFLILTRHRLFLVEEDEESHLHVRARGLETIAAPTLNEEEADVPYIRLVGSLFRLEENERAVCDEIAHLRAIRLSQLGLGGVSPTGASATATSPTREVITREIVRVPCRYCRNLVDQTAVRCPSCSASLS